MNQPPRILVVDDEPDMRWVLARTLREHGFAVAEAADGKAALEQVAAEPPAAVILDLRMPGLDGMVVLERLLKMAPRVAAIILTGYGDIPGAVRAMRLGAYDYLTKPFEPEDLALRVERALERRDLVAEVEGLRSRLRRGSPLREQMGRSPQIHQVIGQVDQVAGANLTVLVQGETGAGKELVARAIHQQSDRHDGPFVALDCGAIPEALIESELFGYERGAFTGALRRKQGQFELAEGGTLFLDEVANLPLPTQAKLLRVLEEREVLRLGGGRPVPVNVRIIASCNVPLDSEVRLARFRQDLYFRLAEFVITLPPLRERREDIPYLANRFLAEARMELKRAVRGISPEAADALVRHAWPGNARELRNVIRQAALRASDLIGPDHLELQGLGDRGAGAAGEPAPGLGRFSLREVAAQAAGEAERRAIHRALQAARGNKSEAARLLQTDYKTLHLKMRRYGIRAGPSGGLPPGAEGRLPVDAAVIDRPAGRRGRGGRGA
jgi:two-component system nitrogen regulation response regulator GlnG